MARQQSSELEGPTLESQISSDHSRIIECDEAAVVIQVECCVQMLLAATDVVVLVAALDSFLWQLYWARPGYFADDSYEESLVVLEARNQIQT